MVFAATILSIDFSLNIIRETLKSFFFEAGKPPSKQSRPTTFFSNWALMVLKKVFTTRHLPSYIIFKNYKNNRRGFSRNLCLPRESTFLKRMLQRSGNCSAVLIEVPGDNFYCPVLRRASYRGFLGHYKQILWSIYNISTYRLFHWKVVWDYNNFI